MSWEDYSLAAQYLLEERIGTRLRQPLYAEDAEFKSAAATLPRG